MMIDLLTFSTQVVSIVMDAFTDIDIFKEVVDASFRGVPVYILLDELNLKSFLAMAESQDIKIQQLRVGLFFFLSIHFLLLLTQYSRSCSAAGPELKNFCTVCPNSFVRGEKYIANYTKDPHI